MPSSTGGPVDLDRILGRIPVVLVFLEPPDDAAARQALGGMGAHLVDFGRDRVQLLAVANRPVEEVEALDDLVEGNVRILADPDGTLASRFGGAYLRDRPTTVLVDVRGRVSETWTDAPSPELAVELLRRVEAYEE
ncbi:MAG: redoxin domain-containing protein [Actinobacteria bacterium]|nr:redoxin domain-containing protein [Actinomycetota bacterium]